MRRFTLSKKVAAGMFGVGVALTASAAWAYFTTSGSGTGTASSGTSTPVVLHGVAATALYPGTSSTVSFTVDNPSTGHQFVQSIHLVSVTTDLAHAACLTTDYTMPDVVVDQDVPAGNGTVITATGTLTMANTGVSQDACKLAPLTLNFTSS